MISLFTPITLVTGPDTVTNRIRKMLVILLCLLQGMNHLLVLKQEKTKLFAKVSIPLLLEKLRQRSPFERLSQNGSQAGAPPPA